jgi:hypothetical protein
VYDDDGNL